MNVEMIRIICLKVLSSLILIDEHTRHGHPNQDNRYSK